MSSPQRPSWQLPPGVPPGAWEYAQSRTVAREYDQHFRDEPLFELDLEVVRRVAPGPEAGWFVDLGCGTGRAAVEFAARGYRTLAVDLSVPMLEQTARKALARGVTVHRLLANLVQLDCLRDQVAGVCVCLFSTLGMIRPRQNRIRVLQHVHRLLRPGGVFVLHVHNRWFNLWDRSGRWWLVKNALESLFGRDREWGDKCYPYRGVSRMFLHVFSLGEIRRDLRRARLAVQEVVPVPGHGRGRRLPQWIPPALRAAGWLLVCRRGEDFPPATTPASGEALPD